MKKILILAMSCRHEYFLQEIDIIKNTWASSLPENVEFAYYDGGWSSPEIVKEGSVYHIKVSTPDDLEHTFLKTYAAVASCINGIEFDWMLRTNTSTWINSRLLRKLVDENILDRANIYGTDLYSLTEAACPEPLNIYPRGNCILMHRSQWRDLLAYGIPLLYSKQVDDVAIGNAINSKHIMQTGRSDSWEAYVKGLPHGWYRCVSKLFNCGHMFCRFGENGDRDFYNNFLTVQTKMYRQRDNEHDNMIDFWAMMKDSPEPETDLCIKSLEDPSIFLGSAIGYAPYSKWKTWDKSALYEFEKKNKASDDKENKSSFNQQLYDDLHRIPGK